MSRGLSSRFLKALARLGPSTSEVAGQLQAALDEHGSSAAQVDASGGLIRVSWRYEAEWAWLNAFGTLLLTRPQALALVLSLRAGLTPEEGAS